MPFFGNLEGATVVGADGSYLGTITWNSVDSESLTNPIGPYGSRISGTSIFNQIGPYGSAISSLSAFNQIASDPPSVFVGEDYVAFLSVNPLISPRIDPRKLFGQH
jgi:hypothetical protein